MLGHGDWVERKLLYQKRKIRIPETGVGETLVFFFVFFFVNLEITEELTVQLRGHMSRC